MTIEEVQQMVEQIRRMAGDPEAAHGTQDQLYRSVLATIMRKECDDPSGLARAALEAEDIDFPRWCA